MTQENARFTPLQRTLHWIMAAAILVMLYVGVGMVSSTHTRYPRLLIVHECLGIAVLVLGVIRLIVRIRKGAPALPASLPAALKIGATLSHYALYVLMIGMPIVGWAMQSSAGYPIRLVSFVLPPILPVNETIHAQLWQAHVWLGFAFFSLLLLHIAAALFHALVRHDGVFESMAPR